MAITADRNKNGKPGEVVRRQDWITLTDPNGHACRVKPSVVKHKLAIGWSDGKKAAVSKQP